MFDLGIQELIVIFIVALIVFGPKRLPELARSLGKWVGEIRRAVQSARFQIETELEENNRKASGETFSSASTAKEEDKVKTDGTESGPEQRS